MTNPPGCIFPFQALEVLKTLGLPVGLTNSPIDNTHGPRAPAVNNPHTARPSRRHIQTSNTLTYPQKEEN
jgi:hypothetical protein